MIQHLETDARLVEQKDNLPLPHQMRRLTPTVRHRQKVRAAEAKRGTFPCRYREECTNPLCDYGHPPVCQNYRSETQDANVAHIVIFDMLMRRRTPSKKSKKGSVIGSVIEGDNSIGLCVSRFISEKIYSKERGTSGIKTRSQILQGHVAPN